MMNVRLVASPVLVLMLFYCAPAQSMPSNVDQAGSSARVIANTSVKQNLMSRVAEAEAAVRQAEAAHATNVLLSKTYLQLGLWYQTAALWERAEAAFEHAVSLLRNTPEAGADLATAISQVASLHVTMGKYRESEKEQQEALRLREAIGDRLQIARSQDDFAILYLSKQKYEKARDLARQAEAEFVRNGHAEVLDRMTARFTLAEALCYLKDCPSAITLLKTALAEAQASLRPEDFNLGLCNFLLGYAYWKSGNMATAALYLERGTVQMNTLLGWGHPAYLRALTFYAEFLHENRQVEAANVIESRIRQASSVVDVRSIQTTQGTFGAGLR